MVTSFGKCVASRTFDVDLYFQGHYISRICRIWEYYRFMLKPPIAYRMNVVSAISQKVMGWLFSNLANKLIMIIPRVFKVMVQSSGSQHHKKWWICSFFIFSFLTTFSISHFLIRLDFVRFWPWRGPWIFKDIHWICYDQIAMKWKTNI